MMSYEKLVKNPRRFRAVTGMSAKEFDLLVSKVEKKYPRAEKKRLSRENRVRAIGAGRRFALNVRDQVMLLLFYYRTYTTQDVAAVMFEIGQASVFALYYTYRAHPKTMHSNTYQDTRPDEENFLHRGIRRDSSRS